MFGFCDEIDDNDIKPRSRNLIRNISDDKVQFAEENSAKTEQMDQFKQDIEIEQLHSYEIGFSSVIKHMVESKKPIVGHNVKFDLAFIYH